MSLLFFFLLFYCFIVSLFNPHKTLAQGLSLSISPPILEVIIKPDKSITQTYKLTNDGEPVIIVPRLLELTASGIKEDAQFTPEKWIRIINTDVAFDRHFLLPAKKTKQIILQINPLAGTEEKDYLRAFVFSTKPNPAGETSSSSVAENLATPLLVTVTSTGLLPKGALITKFALPKFIDSFGPLETNIEVKNTGKTYFHPYGKITLAGLIGKGNYPIIPQVIFADQTKKIITEESVSKKSAQTLSLSGFFIGKYELKIDFFLDEGTISFSQTKTFYALPFRACIIVLSAIIVLYLFKKIRLGKKKKLDAKR